MNVSRQRAGLRSGLTDSRKLRVSPHDTTAQLLHLLHTPLGQTPSLAEVLPVWKIKSSPEYLQQQDDAVKELAAEASLRWDTDHQGPVRCVAQHVLQDY